MPKFIPDLGRTINQTFHDGYSGSKYTSKKRLLLVSNKSENRVSFLVPIRMVTDVTCGRLIGGTGDIASATDTFRDIDLAGHLGKLESATHTYAFHISEVYKESPYF